MLQRCLQQVYSTHPYPKDAIQVTPQVSLYDQNVHIRVRGLPSQVKVTVHMSTDTVWRREHVNFMSCGHYVTDTAGEVDLAKDVSVSGTYTGVEPMGLFWSVQPSPSSPQNSRKVVKDVTVPVIYTLSLYLHHLTLKDLDKNSAGQKPISTVTLERIVMPPTVRRLPVRDGLVRGTLFLPPGEGPFPGIIDMFGLAGGLMEARAAMLASHGFAALALPFYRYQDLPEFIDCLNFEYFESAARWLQAHSSVKAGGLGIMGTSGGGAIGTLMAYHCPQIKAFVRINAPGFLCIMDMYYKGQLMLKGIQVDASKTYRKDGALVITEGWMFSEEDILPLWQKDVHMMMLVSEEDGQTPSYIGDLQYQLYPPDRRHLLEVVRYPGAGHLLEPPFTPFVALVSILYLVMTCFGVGTSKTTLLLKKIPGTGLSSSLINILHRDLTTRDSLGLPAS